MYTAQGVQAYRQSDIGSMTREKLIVLLYEKIVSDLNEVVEAVGEGDRLRMTQRINHSQRIVSELRNALDHSIGGDISRNLESLYDYLFHQHLEMLVDQDIRHAQNCLRVLKPLLDAWRQVPVGTGEKAARDHARGELVGPETARDGTSAPSPDGRGAPHAPPAEGGEPVGVGAESELVSYSA